MRLFYCFFNKGQQDVETTCLILDIVGWVSFHNAIVFSDTCDTMDTDIKFLLNNK